jgi:hypothetical protein
MSVIEIPDDEIAELLVGALKDGLKLNSYRPPEWLTSIVSPKVKMIVEEQARLLMGDEAFHGQIREALRAGIVEAVGSKAGSAVRTLPRAEIEGIAQQLGIDLKTPKDDQ